MRAVLNSMNKVSVFECRMTIFMILLSLFLIWSAGALEDVLGDVTVRSQMTVIKLCKKFAYNLIFLYVCADLDWFGVWISTSLT